MQAAKNMQTRNQENDARSMTKERRMQSQYREAGRTLSQRLMEGREREREGHAGLVLRPSRDPLLARETRGSHHRLVVLFGRQLKDRSRHSPAASPFPSVRRARRARASCCTSQTTHSAAPRDTSLKFSGSRTGAFPLCNLTLRLNGTVLTLETGPLCLVEKLTAETISAHVS